MTPKEEQKHTDLLPLSGSVISRAAKAMHDKGVELGHFGMKWEAIPADRQVNYEHLAVAAINAYRNSSGCTYCSHEYDGHYASCKWSATARLIAMRSWWP